jgi:hypothetical protein
MGARFEPAQVFAPHLSATQMLPLRSTATPAVDPHVRPSGSFAQFSTVRYGFGRELTGCGSAWVCALAGDIAIIAIMAVANLKLTRPECCITKPP